MKTSLFAPNPFLLLIGTAACCFDPPDATAAEATDATPLDQLVMEIEAAHPELLFYQAEIDVARAQQSSAGSWAEPELSFDIGHMRVTGPLGMVEGEGTAWAVSVSQTFEWPGRGDLRKAIANQDVALAELGLEQFRSALRHRARLLGYGLHVADKKARAVSQVAARFQALKETLVARDPAGLTPLLETRVIEAQELALQRRATDAALARDAALLELNRMRGVALDSPLRLARAEFACGTAPETTAALGMARENNFEYRAARLELEQLGYVAQLARHERYPALTVSPFYADESAGERERTFGVGFSLPLPITSRGGSQAELAEARRRQAEVLARVSELELEHAVVTAVRAYTAKVAEMERWSPDAVAAFREAASTADRHFRLGAVPLSTYVELQTSYLEAVESLLETRRDALEAGLRLEQLTGSSSLIQETIP